MSLQPSASKTTLLLACPRPFEADSATESDPGEAALYGLAFHDVIAACLRSPKAKPLEKNTDKYARVVDRAAKAHDIKHCAQELAGHVKGSVKVLRNWLKREQLEITDIERAYAVRPDIGGSWGARAIEPHDEDHRYDIKEGEVPGTVDLIVATKNRKRVIVVDHKTGMYEDWYAANEVFALPTTVAQLRTLGLAVRSSKAQFAGLELGIFHADRQGLPAIYAEPFDRELQVLHAQKLHAALERRGQGFIRPGEHCAHCPARIGCPARAAALLVESAEVLTEAANKIIREPIDPRALYVLPTEEIATPGLLESRAGALFDMLKRFRELEKVATAELRRLVKSGVVVETKEGNVLSIRTQVYETLSKKSVLEALGKVAGERELARLRKKGVIREATREMLIGEK